MNEMAMTASFMRFSVYQKIFASWTGPTPRTRPAMIAAMKHPVPVAESQLKSKRAASGVSLATTGAARRGGGAGQHAAVARRVARLTAGRAHANSESVATGGDQGRHQSGNDADLDRLMAPLIDGRPHAHRVRVGPAGDQGRHQSPA